jgi:hypothetical protein
MVSGYTNFYKMIRKNMIIEILVMLEIVNIFYFISFRYTILKETKILFIYIL